MTSPRFFTVEQALALVADAQVALAQYAALNSVRCSACASLFVGDILGRARERELKG
jgi:hypothetical protein